MRIARGFFQFGDGVDRHEAVGMFGRVFGTNSMQVALSLFIMGYIRKRDMSQSEPIRLLMAALPWAIGPTLGIWLYNNMGYAAPFLLSACVALILICYAFLIRLDETPVLKAIPQKPANPLTYVPRFVKQPRLRLAYLLIFGRENWWWMVYLYIPVYAEQHDMELEVLGVHLPVGGLALSFCSGLALLARAEEHRRSRRRFGLLAQGIRRVMARRRIGRRDRLLRGHDGGAKIARQRRPQLWHLLRQLGVVRRQAVQPFGLAHAIDVVKLGLLARAAPVRLQ